MRRGLSAYHIVLCKIRLLDTWIKRREEASGVRKIRSKKARKHQYIEGYGRFLESKRVECGANVGAGETSNN